MNFEGTRRVAINTLKLPGDMKARMKAPHVVDLAESIEALGGEPSMTPLIRLGTREVVAGRDRIAACMLLKIPRIDVRVVDGTDAEIAQLELDENLRRRQDNRTSMLAQAVKLETAARKAAEPKETGTDVPPWKERKTAKGKAIEAVAKKAGIKPESARKAVQREKAKANPKPEPIEKPPIDLMGHELSAATLKTIGRIVTLCETIEASAKYQQRDVSTNASILPGGVTVRLMDAAKELQAVAAAVKPGAICYECKGQGDEKCKVCKGAHYARAEQMANVPAEKLQRANGIEARA
jgi:hypothetical protein